ncbi:MAG: hypothetical protein FWG17_06760 [Desulfovibrionaceae bacterium]|nr:hypothetical protein [Desulfovibrionaceae bacterium]
MSSAQLDMYRARQADIVRQYDGKIIAVKDGEVQGVYATKTEALDAMCRRFTPGDFFNHQMHSRR